MHYVNNQQLYFYSFLGGGCSAFLYVFVFLHSVHSEILPWGVSYTLCFKIPLCNALPHPYLQADRCYCSPPILASLSIHHVVYDRSPTSSSSGSPLPLWHSVKQWPAKAPTPARPLVWLLSSHSWPDRTDPPHTHPHQSCFNLAASCGHFRGQNCLRAPLSDNFTARPPLNFSDSCTWEWDHGAYRWLCWEKQRVWVVCHKPGL